MKKLFILLIVFVEFVSANNPKIQTREFPQKEMEKQNEQIALLVAKEISKTLPQTIDKYTTLVTITSKGSTLLYTFEINSGVKSDEAIIKEDHSRMKKAVTNGVCQSSSKFLKAGINTSYIYIGAKSKKELFRFDITQKDCI